MRRTRSANLAVCAKDQNFRERIRSQAIRTINAHAGRFAGGIEALERSGAINVRAHAAHHVMHHRPHRDQFLHRIDIFIAQAKFAHERQLAIDQFFAKMAQVKMYHRPVRPIYGAAFLHFSDVCLRQPVARAQLHVAQYRLGLRRPQVVILKIAIAIFVDEVPTFGPCRLGDQNSGERQPGRVILHKLHVLERSAGAIGERHAVAGLDGGVSGVGEDAAASAGAQNHSFREDGLDSPRH